MQFHPKWLPKYRDLYKPNWFDNINNRWDSRIKDSSHTFKTQDPLFFDHGKEYINGGMQLQVDYIHDKATYISYPKDVAHLLYNTYKAGIYDPVLFEKYEANLRFVDMKNLQLVCRHCFGAVCAYYATNLGSRYGLDWWESQLEDRKEHLHAQEVLELMQAFRKNRILDRSHIINHLNNGYKKTLLDRWKKEVACHQRTMYAITDELLHLEYFDEALWDKIAETTLQKKKINNNHYWSFIHKVLC